MASAPRRLHPSEDAQTQKSGQREIARMVNIGLLLHLPLYDTQHVFLEIVFRESGWMGGLGGEEEGGNGEGEGGRGGGVRKKVKAWTRKDCKHHTEAPHSYIHDAAPRKETHLGAIYVYRPAHHTRCGRPQPLLTTLAPSASLTLLLLLQHQIQTHAHTNTQNTHARTHTHTHTHTSTQGCEHLGLARQAGRAQNMSTQMLGAGRATWGSRGGPPGRPLMESVHQTPL